MSNEAVSAVPTTPNVVPSGRSVDPQVLDAIPVRYHKTLQDLDVFSDDEADEEDAVIMNKNRNNPWFTPEIANIVKLCRKYRRKHHKSKTKKSELKVICRELEKRKRKLIRSAKQKWNGSQKTKDSDEVDPAVGVRNESEQRVPEDRVDAEGVSMGNGDGAHVDGEKIAAMNEAINDHETGDTTSAAMIVAGIDPPTPPLLTPDPPNPSALATDDLYDPVYEIYLMLMRQDNAGADAVEAYPDPMIGALEGDHFAV